MSKDLAATQQKVLALVADGKMNKEIAKELGRSIHTIESHTRQIYIKLAVTNRVEAARWYWEQKQEFRTGPHGFPG